jgi:aquaporin Z
MPLKEFVWYVAAQCAGALVGCLMIALFLGGFDHGFGANMVTGVADIYGVHANNFGMHMVGLVVEIVLTFIFVLAIFGATCKKKEMNMAGIEIAFALTAVHLLGLGLTGTSVNPSRSLFPAIFSSFTGGTIALEQVWIFLVGPMVGAALAAFVWKFITKRKAGEAPIVDTDEPEAAAEVKSEQ